MNITLSADAELIRKSRQYAKAHDTSLNQLVRDYLSTISGAYEALNLFGMSRSYPNAEIPAQAHFAAWESLKNKGATTREEQTPPWETMGPKNHGGRTLEIAFNRFMLQHLYLIEIILALMMALFMVMKRMQITP